MSIIEYQYTEGEEACKYRPLPVRLDGRRAGEIRKVDGGYQYFAKAGSKWVCGDVFDSVDAVQRYLGDES